MVYEKVRGILIACGIAVLGISTPAECKACGFLDCLFGGGGRTTYAPPYAPQTYAPAYNTGYAPYQPQTCQYVPQTCYRTVYRQVPVTTHQAVTRCNPLTGCPVTCYYPVTRWVRQARLVPYTTYRLVYSNPCNPCGSYGSYVGGTGVTVSSGGAPCACGPPSTATTPYYGPSTPMTPTVPPRSTFQNNDTPAPVEEPLQAVPGTNLNSTMPGLNPPSNRTTSRPAHSVGQSLVPPMGSQASYYRLIATAPEATTTGKPPVNDGGWRASRD